jgi:dTMP kinase
VFVTLEGPEGAGKSTVARRLASALEGTGREVLLTREPGSGPVGQRLRSVLLDSEGMTQKCELFLFLADRAQHVESVVRPALERGAIVLCDRYADSTIVYQGHARGLDLEVLRSLNEFATGGLDPDLTLLLDLDPKTGLARLESKDRLDSEPLEFHQKVRNGFLEEAKIEPKRWEVIDASRSPDEVFDDCWKVLQSRF